MRNFKIGTRLALAFAFVMGLMVVISGVGIYQLGEVGKDTEFMAKHAILKERSIRDLLAQIEVNGGRIVAGARNADPVQQKLFKDQVVATIERNNILVKKIEASLTSETEKTMWAQILADRKLVLASNGAVVKEKTDGNHEEALKVLGERLEPQLKTYIDDIKKLVTHESDLIDGLAAHVESINRFSTILIGLLTGAGIVFGAAFAYWITRSITQPFAAAVKAARLVAAGDLSHNIEVRSTDETGQLMQALKDMNESLHRVISEVRVGIDTVDTASAEIASGNLDLSSRTEQQAGTLEETASAMEELTSTVTQNADNSLQATKLAVSASEVAVEGGLVVRQVIDTMLSIDESSRKIVDIISVIDGIAFQTNILALNAAVEAARAGEQGRGFAVVASEVRNLAQRSASAAKEIKTLIGKSVEKVNIGSELVEQAGVTIDAVVQSVKRVADIVSEISAASQEQRIGIEQVNQAINQMDEATQQNSALVEQAAAASQSLREQAGNLAQVVNAFKLDDAASRQQSVPVAKQAAPVRSSVRPATRKTVNVTPPVARLKETAPSRTPQSAIAPSKQDDSDSWEQF
ncbi:methyl-accepting chemotaxis protein [Herbaspirillum sp. RTI4]|uniref:methyl-accepting chemotaxis protein n=1 Tax=Herbaspirillum sp. RTI4 TaxID=3048640 RepID=UPI002AB36EE2|nr:methyl-accepting chemotaxis protein [Herbaspirillum sp. RTI4]MDY7577668.1 methyl-accepting chemotaxis protein [Herbaspirillum sp. RTI4]MEA9982166.1 methyl-accepting chemotaxis protein [Herbaspirillum sp. RTI4]